MKLLKDALFKLPDDLPASAKFRHTAFYATCYTFLSIITIALFAVWIDTPSLGWIHIHHFVIIVVISGCVLAYRFMPNYHLAAFLLVIGANMIAAGAAITSGNGIYEDCLPFVTVAIFAVGIISGVRMTILMGVMTLFLVIGLAFYTVYFGPHKLQTTQYSSINNAVWLKAMYLGFANILSMSITIQITRVTHNLFEKMDEAIQQAKEAEQSKARFLANMSHELRTPLNGVIGMSGLLLRTELNPQQNQYATIVNDCSKGLVSIINDVLDISKLDAGMFTLRPELFSPISLIEHITSLHRSNAEAKGLSIYARLDPNLPEQVYADKGRLQQVLNNLVSNAVKFTAQGHVTVMLKAHTHHPGRIGFYVSDTGIGLSPEACEKVFERFHQVDSSLSRGQDGTGLGLSICKEFVGFLGGELELISEEGKGSTFYFTLDLPLEAVDMETQKTAVIKRQNDNKPAATQRGPASPRLSAAS